jgi:hypothetical protein
MHFSRRGFPGAGAAGLLLLAACGGAPTDAAPSPAPPALPILADEGLERECACVERSECAVPDAFEGQSESRNRQCHWDDRPGGTRATCSSEGRFRQNAPNAQWAPWSRSTVRFRRARDGGWCWAERGSDRVL